MNDSSKEVRSGTNGSGRVMMILVGLSLILIGSLFILLMGRSYLRAKEMREWPLVECVILQSSVEQRQHDPYSPPEFSHQIRFAFEWKGESYTGDRISLRGTKWSSKRSGVDASLADYPVGSLHQCHIKPDEPSLAVLEPDSLAPLYSIWFPALFAVGGIGMIISTFRKP